MNLKETPTRRLDLRLPTALILVAVFILSMVGCSNVEMVDQSDPKVVAEAFYSAIKADNADLAAAYVLAKDREGFRKAVASGSGIFLGVKDLESIVVTLDARKSQRSNGQETEARVQGLSGNIDMIKIDGKWWMCK